MPGLILRGIKKCGSNNCVIMLDEVDKLERNRSTATPPRRCSSARHRAEPRLNLTLYLAISSPYPNPNQVLDPEQSHAFRDHFLNLPFNLSGVLFIATANELQPIPACACAGASAARCKIEEDRDRAPPPAAQAAHDARARWLTLTLTLTLTTLTLTL